MLTKIREKFTGGIAVAILALIGIPFLFFGVNTSFVGQQFAAKVDGSEIAVVQFEQAYRDQLEANPSWAELPDEYRLQLRQGILDSLIRDRLIEMHLIDAGYQISDEALTATIQRIPEFQVDGAFDMETYRSLLLQNGFEPTSFEASQRRALRQDQLQRAIAATALVTPAEYRRYLNLIAEQRLVSLADFEIASVAADIEVTEARIVTFYEENETMFLTDESADIEFIEVRRDLVAEGIDISDATLLNYYEDNKDRYLQDEQRQARHILILFNEDREAAEAKAADLFARVQAGESFEALAQEHSDDGGTAARGGDLGVLTRSQLPGELGSAIFSMEQGNVEGPLESDFGFHVVRLDNILEPGPLPLEQVRGELLSDLRGREADDAFFELQRQVSDALFDAEDMQAISDVVGLEIQTIAGFTRSGAEPLGSNQAAIDAVFDSNVLFDGEISEVIELDASRSAIFKVTAHNEASRQPMDVVREQIVASIRTVDAESIVFARVEQLLAALDAGEDFGVSAEAAGAVVSASTLVSRDNQEIDQAVMAQIFMARKPTQEGPVSGQVANAAGGYTVYSLAAVLPGRPESIPLADRDTGKLQVAQQAGSSDYYAFVQALYDNADVVISQDALAAQDLLQ